MVLWKPVYKITKIVIGGDVILTDAKHTEDSGIDAMEATHTNREADREAEEAGTPLEDGDETMTDLTNHADSIDGVDADSLAGVSQTREADQLTLRRKPILP
jgi:hypothetical protein